jgi:hypothetical protein
MAARPVWDGVEFCVLGRSLPVILRTITAKKATTKKALKNTTMEIRTRFFIMFTPDEVLETKQ